MKESGVAMKGNRVSQSVEGLQGSSSGFQIQDPPRNDNVLPAQLYQCQAEILMFDVSNHDT